MAPNPTPTQPNAPSSGNLPDIAASPFVLVELAVPPNLVTDDPDSGPAVISVWYASVPVAVTSIALVSKTISIDVVVWSEKVWDMDIVLGMEVGWTGVVMVPVTLVVDSDVITGDSGKSKSLGSSISRFHFDSVGRSLGEALLAHLRPACCSTRLCAAHSEDEARKVAVD